MVDWLAGKLLILTTLPLTALVILDIAVAHHQPRWLKGWLPSGFRLKFEEPFSLVSLLNCGNIKAV